MSASMRSSRSTNSISSLVSISSRQNFIYPDDPLPIVAKKIPDPTQQAVELTGTSSDNVDDFGNSEERPLAEHYYEQASVDSIITMMQQRRRQPRLMSARHHIVTFNSSRCFANNDNNFEIYAPREQPKFFTDIPNSDSRPIEQSNNEAVTPVLAPSSPIRRSLTWSSSRDPGVGLMTRRPRPRSVRFDDPSPALQVEYRPIHTVRPLSANFSYH